MTTRPAPIMPIHHPWLSSFWSCCILGAIVAMSLSSLNTTSAQLPGTHYLDRDREHQIGLRNARFLQSYQIDSAEVYQVNIKVIESGALVMTGAYTDSTLTTEQGYFHYFFANGSPESEGQFSNGIKTGIWKRWNFVGDAKTDRIYPPSTIIY